MKKNIKLSTFISLVWILLGIAIINLPSLMKSDFNIETGKTILICYLIITVAVPLIYNIHKGSLKKNK